MSQQTATYVDEDSFERDTDYISDRITRDERDGWPVEPGRYRLVAAKACPWATRSIIVRSLLGLEDVISLGLAAPSTTTGRGPSTSTPADATRCSASTSSGTPTNGASPATTRASRCPPWSTSAPARSSPTTSRGSPTTSSSSGPTTTATDAPDLWPDAVRDEMEEVMERVYADVNNGVYQCGFAGSQESYERAYDRSVPRPRLARGAPRRRAAT